MPLASGTNLGPYQILAPIGAGGMGEVYRARDTKLKREVALKVLPDVFARDSGRMIRFQREAEVLASLNHPNIAAIYGVEERALVMELVEGETLPSRLPVDTALRYAKQIAEALEFAHERGVVHRDLKPANVKVTSEGAVKLLDFGLAKAVEDPATTYDDPSNSPTLTLGGTRVGVILGTAAYMSPEQASGKPVDRRSDIWSFGAVLYEMLSGEPAFHGESVSHTLASVLKLDPDWSALPASTPTSIRRLVQRCLTRDRKQRLQAIGEARIEIERQLANPESGAELAQQAVTGPSRLPWILAAAALAAALAIVSFLHFRETRPPEHVLRYTLATPENSAATTFAVSPDGRFIVMSANVNGKRQLWLRALGELEWQPMPFTEDAGYPFWSPDSRNIGFFAQGRLKRIAVSGGQAQTLCQVAGTPARNVAEVSGGSWNRDDVIVFPTRGEPSGIQRVSAGGGVPAVVIKGEGLYRFPVFLPDGRHFLYAKGRVQGIENNTVSWSSLDGGESRAVLEDVPGAVFAPSTPGSSDGYLLFIRQDTLMAQQFNAARGELTAGEFPVVEGVAINPRGPYTPVVVSGNGVLVYWNSAAADSTEIVWFDRAGRRTGSVGATGHIVQPTISPDEKTVAFSRGSGTTSELWLWDVTRGTDTRLTNNGVRNNDPIWSPRGDRILFRSEQNRSPGDLYLRSTNGTGQDQLLVTTRSNKIPSQWSPDGKLIVYSTSTAKTSWDIWVLPMSEDAAKNPEPKPFLQSEASEVQGQLSPDGRWMAYASSESGQREVYLRSFPDATGKQKISTAGGAQPRWRGDGKELFFVAADAKMMAVSIKATAGPKPSFEAGTPVPLFEVHVDDEGIAYRYDVTRDGTRFLVETAATSIPRLTVWSNWIAGLKK